MMNKLYSERNGMREPIKKTAKIDADAYAILWNCCDRYRINLAWKYPEYCQDNPQVICGVNEEKLNVFLKKAIPDLIYGYPSGKYYLITENPFDVNDVEEKEIEDVCNLYSILDYIEFIAQWMKTVKKGIHHDFFNHDHLSFADDNKDFELFQMEINEAFDICGLLFHLTNEKIVERVVEDDFAIEESKSIIDATPEIELKKLIEQAIALHKSRNPDDCHLATEKIWDALERLKTIYIDEGIDKKTSADKIISHIANDDANYVDLFNTEFVCLTSIGNNYRIRHHEVGKTEVPNDDYYDYFFSRCFSLIVLALKYL